jgi:hypothetical protein
MAGIAVREPADAGVKSAARVQVNFVGEGSKWLVLQYADPLKLR